MWKSKKYVFGQLGFFQANQGGQCSKDHCLNYFDTVPVLDLKKARCVYCKCLLSVDLMDETSHLHAHVKSSLEKKNQVVRQSFFNVDNKNKVKSQAFDQQRFRKKLVSMIIVHENPLSIVDHVGFKNYSFSLRS
uniref:BED-type domain-containing protein n=1 Tax=Kalanchoe fedtschenkoi TaxID=63787 RepID=A0A7N0U9I8_KALFE